MEPRSTPISGWCREIQKRESASSEAVFLSHSFTGGLTGWETSPELHSYGGRRHPSSAWLVAREKPEASRCLLAKDGWAAWATACMQRIARPTTSIALRRLSTSTKCSTPKPASPPCALALGGCGRRLHRSILHASIPSQSKHGATASQGDSRRQAAHGLPAHCEFGGPPNRESGGPGSMD